MEIFVVSLVTLYFLWKVVPLVLKGTKVGNYLMAHKIIAILWWKEISPWSRAQELLVMKRFIETDEYARWSFKDDDSYAWDRFWDDDIIGDLRKNLSVKEKVWIILAPYNVIERHKDLLLVIE